MKVGVDTLPRLGGIGRSTMHSKAKFYFAAFAAFFSALLVSAADTNRAYIIPDLRAWSKVKEGLSVSELEKLLGQPIGKPPAFVHEDPDVVYPWTYGYVV